MIINLVVKYNLFLINSNNNKYNGYEPDHI